MPTWIFVAPDAPAERVAALRARGVSVMVAERDRAGRVDLADAVFQLGRAGITTLLVEGGSTIARSLVEEDLVDVAEIVTAPALVGEGGIPALAGLPLARLTDDPSFETIGRRMLGTDRLQRFWRKESP